MKIYYIKSLVSKVMAVGELRSDVDEPNIPVVPATVIPYEKPRRRRRRDE